MTVDRELHGLIDELLSDRPARALAAYRRLADEVFPGRALAEYWDGHIRASSSDSDAR